MKKTYRVIIWGPGGVGGACMREVVRLPEFELAGVLVYSDSKNGKDAGELVGIEPVGIKATNNKDDIFALDADCVLHTPRDYGDFSADEEIIRLLESGKNVITALPYQHPQVRGPEIVEKLMSACHKGGTCLHATGIDPGFVVERLGLALTGICNDIKRIEVQEAFDCSRVQSPLFLDALGIGCDPNAAGDRPAVELIANNYLRQVVVFMGEKLGVSFDRVEKKPGKLITTPDDITIPVMTVKKGTVARLCHRWIGYVGENPFFTLEANWYLGDAMKPFPEASGNDWVVTVEGRPSARMVLNVKASIENDLLMYEGDPTVPTYYATAIAMVQAVPLVCAAEPGILYPPLHSAHWMPDLRDLV